MASEKYILNIGYKRNVPRAGGVAGSVNPYHVLRELGQGARVWLRPGSTREAEGTLVVEVRLDPRKHWLWSKASVSRWTNAPSPCTA